MPAQKSRCPLPAAGASDAEPWQASVRPLLQVRDRDPARALQRLQRSLHGDLRRAGTIRGGAQALWRDLKLPELDLPLNAADEPLAVVEEHPAPIMSFCRTPDRVDILIPNLLEGEPIPAGGLRPSRAGTAGRAHVHCNVAGHHHRWVLPGTYTQAIGAAV